MHEGLAVLRSERQTGPAETAYLAIMDGYSQGSCRVHQDLPCWSFPASQHQPSKLSEVNAALTCSRPAVCDRCQAFACRALTVSCSAQDEPFVKPARTCLLGRLQSAGERGRREPEQQITLERMAAWSDGLLMLAN